MPVEHGIQRLDIDSVIVDRTRRQRRAFNEDRKAQLKESIKINGLIQPIIIKRDKHIVAGETRLTIYRELRDEGFVAEWTLPDGRKLTEDFTRIPYRYLDECSAEEAEVCELEENLKRTDLDWDDQVLAIQRLHRNWVKRNPDWKMEQTAEALGYSAGHISKVLTVADQLDNPQVKAAGSVNAAYNVIQRTVKRGMDDFLTDILLGGTTLPAQPATTGPTLDTPVSPEQISRDAVAKQTLSEVRDGTPVVSEERPAVQAPTLVPPPPAEVPIINEDFTKWLETYDGRPFNFIHCDFPYGINHGKSAQGNAAQWGGYDDSEDVYWTLCNALATNARKLLGVSGHVMFWFSMNYYERTCMLFEKAGFVVEPYPLVWHKSDNKGIIPDAQRGPRRTYETALLMNWGDRNIVKPVANAISHPSPKEQHLSEKPMGVLEHFFQMFVDRNSRVLDPTCGSGTSIRAAKKLHAAAMLGIELNPQYAEDAKRSFCAAQFLDGVGL